MLNDLGKLAVAAWALTILLVSTARAQRLDSFEGGLPRWRLVESDCGAQLVGHEISTLNPHSGRTAELFELNCGNGQFALMAYPIEPCAVLNEFQPSIWVRCASAQVRLGVRVVFPNAIHPVQHNRLTTILWGDSFIESGQWQRLRVQQLGDRIQHEMAAIRNQFDKQLNLDQPYIDALVINAYVGAGQTRVQVDDLDFGSIVPLTSTGIPLASDWREKWIWRDDNYVQFNTLNQIPIWVDNRGEQPAWLRSLGFNGMFLPRVPSPSQLDQVFEAGMAIISPPPEHLVQFDEKKLVAVKGWLIGTALNRDQAELARQQARYAEQLPQAMKRPLVGEALEQFWLFGRIANEIIVPAPDPIAAGETAQKRAWLSKNLETAKHRGEGWASVYVGANPALADQYRTALEVLQGSSPNAPPANPIGLRNEVIGAIMAGAKGIVYRTQSPLLDPITSQTSGATNPSDDRATQAAIRWTNSDLRLWSPWILFGQQVTPPSLNRNDFACASWRVRDADLIIVQNVNPNAQLCMPGTRNAPLSLSLNVRQDPHEVIRLTEGRMELMPVNRNAGSQTWQVNSPNHVEVFVVTGNTQVSSYLRQRLNRQVMENASDQLEIANHCVELASELIEARFRINRPLTTTENQNLRSLQQQQLMGVERNLERGWQALQAGQNEIASSIALQMIDQTHAIMFESFVVAVRNLQTPQASPMVLLPGTLKYHWLLANACERSTWRDLPLPGSQFENLNQMLQAGWTQQRRLEDQVDLRVELVPPAVKLGPSLRMAAYPKSTGSSGRGFEPIPGGYEGASLRVRSAGAEVRKGQLVRVSAVAHIRACGSDPASGLLVYDNQAWTSLGQLIHGKAGDRVPIELYRFVNQDGEFQLLAECRGICDIQLESIVASVIEPATDRSSFQTSPRARAPRGNDTTTMIAPENAAEFTPPRASLPIQLSPDGSDARGNNLQNEALPNDLQNNSGPAGGSPTMRAVPNANPGNSGPEELPLPTAGDNTARGSTIQKTPKPR